MSSNQISKGEKHETDIVVIGGGGCGMAAAVAAAEKGAKVTLLEKKGAPGGNTVFGVGLFAAESPAQRRLSIDITKDDAFKMAMDYSHWKINPRIFRAFVEKSGDTIRWLEEKGLKFTNIPHVFPSLNLRTWHTLEYKKAGPEVLKALRKNCEELGVQLLFHCSAKKILTNEKGEVAGVLAVLNKKEFRITTKNVIIASGGYGGNKELLKKYYPSYSENMHYLGLRHLTGDGLLMAIEAGAATEGLGALMLHPHFFPGSSYVNAIAQEPLTVLVNKNGERFVDETISFNPTECGNAVDRQPDKCVYALFDEKIKRTTMEEGTFKGSIEEAVGSYIAGTRATTAGVRPTDAGTKLLNLDKKLQLEADKGGVKISDSWDEIAGWMGVAPKVLKVTIEEYNSFCDHGYDKIFAKDRRYLQALRTPPYYAIRCYLCFLVTIGGIKINQHMEVLDHDGKPIPGLYAGGDSAGGWESDTYNIILSGSAFGFAVNSGRIAGENAATNVFAK